MNLITPMLFPVMLSLSLWLSQKLFPQQGMNNNQNDKTWYKCNEKKSPAEPFLGQKCVFSIPSFWGEPNMNVRFDVHSLKNE